MTAPVSREQVRLVLLLSAASRAGLVPLDVRTLHTFAYLANVLSPVWDMPPMDGSLLKTRDGPYYPVLQHDLDRLVGMGIAMISDLGHEVDHDGRWRLRGSFRLNDLLAAPVLQVISTFEDEARVHAFLVELALALSGLPREMVARAPMEDATYADSLTTDGNVLDFGEWRIRNYSTNAARRFQAFVPEGITATQAELLHLYVRHLRLRLTS